MRGHKVGDVGAGDQQHQNNEDAEPDQSAAVIVLQGGDTGSGWLDQDLHLQEHFDVVFRHADKAMGSLGLKVQADSIQLCPQRLDGDAWIDDGQDAEPSTIVAGDQRVHHGGQKNIGDGTRFGAGEGLWVRRQ